MKNLQKPYILWRAMVLKVFQNHFTLNIMRFSIIIAILDMICEPDQFLRIIFSFGRYGYDLKVLYDTDYVNMVDYVTLYPYADTLARQPLLSIQDQVRKSRRSVAPSPLSF